MTWQHNKKPKSPVEEIEIGRIRKDGSKLYDIVIKKLKCDDPSFAGIDIRLYNTAEGWVGPTKAGVRIPPKNWVAFKEIINSIQEE